MTTLTSTRLTDSPLVALSGAAQRQDGAVSLPAGIKGMAAQKLATSLMDKRFCAQLASTVSSTSPSKGQKVSGEESNTSAGCAANRAPGLRLPPASQRTK